MKRKSHTKVIYVCYANRFRSPTAEFLHKMIFGKSAESAGTDATTGLPMSHEMVEALIAMYQKRDVLSFAKKFRSRNIYDLVLNANHMLIALDHEVFSKLQNTLWNCKIKLLNQPYGIPDPFLTNESDRFKKTIERIKKAIESDKEIKDRVF